MLYNEFIEGTGCKDNRHNYKVYKDLEIMYMNSDMTKAEVYEYGKKLVDNNYKTPEQIALEERITAEIEMHEREIAWLKDRKDLYTQYLSLRNTPEEIREYKRMIKYYAGLIKRERHEVKMLKWVLQ